MIIDWRIYSIIGCVISLFGFLVDNYLVIFSPVILIVILHWRDLSLFIWCREALGLTKYFYNRNRAKNKT